MKSSIRQIAILLVVVLFVSVAFAGSAKTVQTGNTTATTSKKHPPAPAAPVATIHFCGNDVYSSAICDPADNAFSVNTTRDITMFVSWQNVTGTHVQKLVFIMPNGDPYQAISTTFDTTTGQGLQAITPPTVSNVLPVSGTWIQQRGITGAWTVQIFLDDVYITQTTLNFF